MKHVHYDLIEEWARTGKKVQMFIFGDTWVTIGSPDWDPNLVYRLKPEVIKYKRFIYIDSFSNKKLIGVKNSHEVHEPETHPEFKHWIDTEWKEVEV